MSRKRPSRGVKTTVTVGVTAVCIAAFSPEARHYVGFLLELVFQFM
jgi:hypothetical protein